MAGQSTLQTIALAVAKSFAPLQRSLASETAFIDMMRQMGWTVQDIPGPIRDLIAPVDELVSAIRAMDESSSAEHLADLLTAIAGLTEAVAGLQGMSFDASLSADGFAAEFPSQLIDYLLVEYLSQYQTVAMGLLGAFGLVRMQYHGASGNRPPFVTRKINWDMVGGLLDDPSSLFQTVFGWNTDEFDFGALVSEMENLMAAIRIPVYLAPVYGDEAEVLEDGGEVDGDARRSRLNVPFFAGTYESGQVEVGVGLFALPKTTNKKPGFALLPYVKGNLATEITLDETLTFRLSADLDVEGGIAMKVRPRENVEVIAGLSDPDTATGVQGQIEVRLEYTADSDSESILLLGESDGSRLELLGASVEGGLYLDSSAAAELYLEISLVDANIIVTGGDGFIQKIFPEDGITADFDLTIGWSNKKGIYFRGSSALEVSVPTHIDLGIVSVDAITIALRPEGVALPLELGATVTTELGPLFARVDNIGLRADFAFPGSGGNLGPLDIELGFKPPDGVSLSVDTQGFAGGGFLYLDPDKGQYSGGLELNYQNLFTLAAVGILDTQMPDGSSGFSLLIIISAEFTPIQLGFGFTLNGVGGLLGLNRTMELEVLQEGLKTGAADNVLFPSDIIANADQIISDVSEIFPVYEDHFVFGPMAEIGWGTPTLISAQLGLLIEVPDPVQIAIVGVVKAALPSEDAGLLVLQVSFLGTIDFESGLVAFDASLFDSKLLSYTLSGDMSLRLSWGEDPNFLLSVGGFHPAYDPPPMSLPDMDRLSISLINGNNPRITLESYFAVTSNTVQLGSKLEVYAEAWKIYVFGFMSFDALFQLSPFYFTIAVSAMVEVGMGQKVLMSVSLALDLEGPTPWKANGTASFKVLGVKVEVRFNETFGQSKDTTLPDIAVLPQLEAALSQTANWSAELPSQSSMWVSLREISAAEGLVVHPAGTLKLSQKVVPLQFTIDKFGSQKPSDANYFAISTVKSGGEELEISDVKEYFAPAQYESMSNSEKLARASFEQMKSGVEISAGEELSAGGMVKRDVEYEAVYIDTNYLRYIGGKLAQLLGVFQALIRGCAAAKMGYSYQKTRKSTLAPVAIHVQQEGFSVVSTVDLTPYGDDSGLGSQAEAHDYMNRLVRQDASLASQIQVVPAYEVNAA